MSNILPGKVIHSQGDGLRLVSHANGHIVTWNRNYDFDGNATNTWRAVDHGFSHEAAECYPGLAGKILEDGVGNGH